MSHIKTQTHPKDFSYIPMLVRVLQMKLDDALLTTANMPSGFVRATSPTEVEMGVVHETAPGVFKVMTHRVKVSKSEMAGRSSDQSDLGFNYLFEELYDVLFIDPTYVKMSDRPKH